MYSILIRSIGRKSLGRALASVAIQDRPCLVVLVDAIGELFDLIPNDTTPEIEKFSQVRQQLETFEGHTVRTGFVKHSTLQPGLIFGAGWPVFSDYPFDVLLVSTGQQLSRASAADLALRIGAPLNEYAIFLDDDDVFLEGHLAALESALRHKPDAVLAHTAAYVSSELHLDCSDSEEKPPGFPIGRQFEPWQLLYSNHIPIHCALFRTDVIRREGITFDTQFEVFEDWDFWLQMQSKGDFCWVEGCTALYSLNSANGSSSGVSQLERDDESYRKLWLKWRYAAPSQWWTDLLAVLGPSLNRLDGLEHTVAHLVSHKEDSVRLLEEHRQSIGTQREAIEDLKLELSTQFSENERLHLALASVQRELSERIESFEAERVQFNAAIDANLKRERGLIDEHLKRERLFFDELVKLRAAAENQVLANQGLHNELQTVNQAYQQRDREMHEQQAHALAAAEQWRRRAESLATQSAQLQHQLQATLYSRSWRVTKPLRQLGTIARRLGMGKLYRRLRARVSQLNVALTPRSQVDQNSHLVDANLSPGRETKSDSQQDLAPPPSLLEQVSDLFDPYQHWISRFEPKHFKERWIPHVKAPEGTDDPTSPPLISIVMPIFNAPLNFFKAAIASVQKQHNPNWELCIADDASTDKESLIWLKQEMLRDSRIKLVERSQNGHIAACSNSALALATADWIALMDQDDLLSPFAIVEVLSAIEQYPNAMLIYSDEDKVNNNGLRSDPYFKPAFNLELLRAQNTFSHLGVYRRSLVNAVGGFQPGTEGSQDHDLVLRCIEQVNADQVIHIPKVLYHWRIHDQSTASAVDAKPYAVTNGLKAVNQHLARTSPGAEAFLHQSIPHYIVRYPLPVVLPNVDIIIPTRNGFEVLDRCLESLFKLTHYPRMKVTVIDNGSDDIRVINLLQNYKERKLIDVLRYDKAFNFSAINNFAVENTSADYVLFLNNDIEIIRADWLDELLRQGCRDEIGAVGAMLWYPDMTMQHAGVVIGAGGVAGHAHHRLPVGHPGYFGRAALALEVCAVTAACLLMPRKLFIELGGFDEESLAVAFNDVDLCLRLRRLGYKVIFTPRAELINHESATRGDDLSPEHRDRFERECAVMRRRWSAAIKNDPSYNPNLEMMSSTFQAYAEPRDCSARSSQLPSG